MPNLAHQLTLGTVSGWALVVMVSLALIKSWPALRKLRMEEDGALRSDLLARINKLEGDVAQERLTCAEQIAELRRDYEARLAAQGRQIDELQRNIFELRRAADIRLQTTVAKLEDPGHD